MKFYEIAGIIAGVLSALDFLLYAVSIIRKKTTPSRATWFIFTVVGFLVFSSYYSVGARETIWVALGYSIGPLVIFLLSIKFGEGGWTYFYRWCLSGALVSVVIWLYTGSAILALIINIFIDFLGILPTIKKSYFRPESEERFPWLITGISCVINMLAIHTWSFDIWVYPVYMLISQGTVVFLLYFPMHKNKSVV